MFTMLLSGTTMNVAACAARIKVDRQQLPAVRAHVVHRHRARLPGRVGGPRPGPACGIGAAAIRRDPDVRRTGDRVRDRMPSGLCGGMREVVRDAGLFSLTLRRVGRGRC
jgi:hypothetical protein